MSYNKRPFGQRLNTMGDIAESVFESALPLGKVERWGWNRPKNVKITAMPKLFRFKPDYYCDSGYLVEVMGLGKDQVLKSMKVNKWESMKEWAAICRKQDTELMFFIWNSYTEEFVVLTWDEMRSVVAKARKRGVESFDDGNEYYPIPWTDCAEAATFVTKWYDE